MLGETLSHTKLYNVILVELIKLSSDCKLKFQDCQIDLWYESREGGLPDMTMHIYKPFEIVHIHPNELRSLYEELTALFRD